MQHYVSGFVFDDAKQRVLLIKKNRPTWQAGLWNGVGGQVESYESSLAAIRRECEEECGLRIEDWTLSACLAGHNYQVDFWSATAQIDQASTVTDEQVQIHDVNILWDLPTLINLPMIAAICRDNSTAHKPIWIYN
jgi:8-oxo-dGTP diphosphatase